MTVFRRAAVAGLLLIVAACAERAPEPGKLTLTAVGFEALPGWTDDSQGEALAAFLLSCERLAPQPESRLMGRSGVGGAIADWRAPCAGAARTATGDDDAARAFFEQWFAPFAARDGDHDEGLFTGYYEPLLKGALRSGGGYTVPLYALPPDLVTVNLGAFRPELRGERISGRVVQGELKPYDSRGEIDGGALEFRAPVIAWVDDPVDAFFLHIQGSGRVALADGEVLRVGYAGTNGHPYVSIGRYLIDNGILTPEEVSLPSIRSWLASRSDAGQSVMAQNPSYVFFRLLEEDGPLGSQGAVLTAGRSIAVDRRHIPLGVPVWLDIVAPNADPAQPDGPLRRLVIAQDTGGAITGPLRGDFFWGFGPDAGAIAGRMKHPGRLYLLLPRALAAD